MFVWKGKLRDKTTILAMLQPTTIILAVIAYQALHPFTLADPTPGSLALPFTRHRVNPQNVPHLARRQSKTVSGTLSNEIVMYLINVTVGTPGQPLSLIIDTGSSDIWFPDASMHDCQPDLDLCSYGTYNENKSSTFLSPSSFPKFAIQYLDGTEVEGRYFLDTLHIGSTAITNLTMARALFNDEFSFDVSPIIGVMGVGLRDGETAAGPGGFSYPNINEMLVTDGLINTPAFSLWLDRSDSQTGQILFGGVDSDKYHGDLIAVPIQPDSLSNKFTSFTVAWSSLVISGSGHTYEMSPSSPQPAVLDSGTTLTYLPNEIVEQILNGVGAVSNDAYGNLIPCDAAQGGLTFSFGFGGKDGPIVNVSISEFVQPLELLDDIPHEFPNGGEVCFFAMEATMGSPIILGESFLRSAYVVYDVANLEIALANTNFNSKSQKIKQFQDGSGIPGAVATASGVSVTQTISDILPSTSDFSEVGDVSISAYTNTPTFVLASPTSTSHSSRTTTTSNDNGTGSTASTVTTSSSSSSTNSNTASSMLKSSPITTEIFLIATFSVVSLLFGGSLILL